MTSSISLLIVFQTEIRAQPVRVYVLQNQFHYQYYLEIIY